MSSDQVITDKETLFTEFDWKRVRQTMEVLNWTWSGGGVPMIADLQKMAHNLLNDVIRCVTDDPKKKSKMTVCSGGFEATAQRFKDSDKIYLELKFVVTSCGNY